MHQPKTKTMLKEFRKFVNKGNVVEMAVGLIMATYFGAIVKSLVNDVVMPPIGYLIGGVSFKKFKYVIAPAKSESVAGAGDATPEVAINYGEFINNIITFVIVAFAVFLVVKYYNKMKEKFEAKKEEAPKAPPAPSKEELLLTEIRDLLKEKN